ncbi:histone-lysine N-methyltransferase [Perkinsus sp. BL_2016]|nr:histone-lysine N-methyltransferase [Perkinsus sp. BL_2016]
MEISAQLQFTRAKLHWNTLKYIIHLCSALISFPFPSNFMLVYEVEDILNSKIEGKRRLFLIKWRGYSAEESTWEPEKHLNCPAIIAKYNAKIANQDSNFSDESDNKEKIKFSSFVTFKFRVNVTSKIIFHVFAHS